MTNVRVSTCIVGGGPAGLMLGLLLAKRGADVLVLEGHENFDREFRGEVLQPSTAHLLDELGLLEYILAQPHSLLDAGKVRLNGREIGEFAFKKIAPSILTPSGCRSRCSWRRFSARRSRSHPSSAGWAPRCRSSSRKTAAPWACSGLRHGKEPFEVRADVVVGADGRYSAVAKMGGFKPEYEHHDFDLVWFTIEQPPGWSSTLTSRSGKGAGPDAAQVPSPYPGRDRPAHRRMATLAQGGSRGRRRPRATARSDLRRFRRRAERLHAVLPARGLHSPDRRLGARRSASHRRRRAHHEPGGRHRRQRRPRHRRRGRSGTVPAPRAWPDLACGSAGRSAPPGGRRPDAPPLCSCGPSRCCSVREAAIQS